MKKGLQVKGLKKSVGNRTILKDVSFHLSQGEVVALLGPNGAGKTTSFHGVTGLIPMSSGKVIVDGTDVSHWPVYRRARVGLGYLPPRIFYFSRNERGREY